MKINETIKTSESAAPGVRKTYAARGLLEWHVILSAGGAAIDIDFTGGTMGANGLIAGRFSTDNPAIQRIIEGSDHFKKGRICLVPR